jgi:hypothetical protein
MNYIRYDKKNCPKWTKRINNSVTDRMLFVLSTVAPRHRHITRRVMEIWERYELLSMLHTATTNNSTPHDNTVSCPDDRQAHILLFPDPNRGASLGLLLNLNSQGYKTFVVPGQGWRTYGSDRDVSWHLSLKFSLFYPYKVHSWLRAPPAVYIKSSELCHVLYLRIL